MVGQLPLMRPRQKFQDLGGEWRQSAPRGQVNPGQKIKSAEKKARKKSDAKSKTCLTATHAPRIPPRRRPYQPSASVAHPRIEQPTRSRKPKMPKATAPSNKRRHNPLEDDLTATGPLRAKAPKRKGKSVKDEDGDQFVDAKASRNILKISQSLIQEEKDAAPKPPAAQAFDSFAFDSRADLDDSTNDKLYDDDDVWGDEEEEVEEIEVDPNDLETFRKFLPEDDDPLLKHGWDLKPPEGAAANNNEESTNLADLIL